MVERSTHSRSGQAQSGAPSVPTPIQSRPCSASSPGHGHPLAIAPSAGEASGGPEEHRAGASLVVWLAAQRWHLRLDLTFRVGAEGCDVKRLSWARAGRRLAGFVKRLAKHVHASVTYFAAPELQRRGVPHWHVLVRFHRHRCPYITHAEVNDLWQVWRTWVRYPQSGGVEGFGWLKYVRSRADATYAAKYVTKRGGEEWLLDTYRLVGLFGFEPVSTEDLASGDVAAVARRAKRTRRGGSPPRSRECATRT